jgi:hypothetical protein
VSALFVAACFISAQPQSDALTTESVLAKVRTALNVGEFRSDHPGLKASGKIQRYGTTADAELVLDGRGRFRTQSSGPLGEVHAFDGSDLFATDWSGATRHLQLQDRDMSLMSAWLTTQFWAAKPDLFSIAVVADQGTDKEAVISLQRKDGLFKVNVTIDRSTWLPTKAAGTLRDNVHSFTFDQFEGPGFKLARHWTRSARGATTEARYDSVEKTKVSESEFRMPVHGAPGAKFDPEKSGVLIVKKTPTGHLLVKPLLAGEDFGWFIFDTGAGYTCFDKALVEKLKMTQIGEVPVGGAVASGSNSPIVRGPDLRLGPITLEKPLGVALDLRLIGAAMGEKISGIVGYPLLQSAVVEIDCATPAITIHNPPKFTLPPEGQWQKLIIDNLHPMVEARYEGDRSGWFLMDTGMADSVVFYTPTVRKYKLLEGRKTGITLQGGVGGMAAAKTGTIEWFELGGHKFENLKVSFAQAAKGAFASEYADGNLGQAVFMPFRLVFDFGNERLAFLKKAGQ